MGIQYQAFTDLGISHPKLGNIVLAHGLRVNCIYEFSSYERNLG